MNQQHTIRLSSWARLVGLALLLGVGLLASLGLASRTAHAQPAATITVSTCDVSHLSSAIGNAASGDTITFGCSGTITVGSPLGISKNLTLDGSGQQVTLSGGDSVQVLSVNSGVSFTLNALTIAHGFDGEGGGGLLNTGGTVSISNSTFANNSASDLAQGGGLLNTGGTVSISNSTFANNSAEGGGGLLNNSNPFNNSVATMSISNSTFANNSASFQGGSLLNFGGTVSISNSTFANNSSGFVGGLDNGGGTVSISQSIVANNTGGNCFGGVSDQGYNLESSTDCGFTGTGSLQNTDPKLDPDGLQNNGGPTQTIALLDGSPAINKIPASACTVTTDQRGISRPQGPACDMGAFEFRVPTLNLPTSPITVNATGPNGAPVTYTATASEPDDASATPTVSCTPASGSTFAIGTKTVNCTASDAASPPDTTTGSFQVVVNGAATQVSNLITTVNSFHLTNSLQTSLDNKLQDVLTAINAGQTATACSELTDFIGHVQSQSGKGLTVSQANQLITAAKQVQAVLGC